MEINNYYEKAWFKEASPVLRGDSTDRPITPTRGTKRPTSGTLKKYLVSVTDLFSRQINIINLSIVL